MNRACCACVSVCLCACVFSSAHEAGVDQRRRCSAHRRTRGRSRCQYVGSAASVEETHERVRFIAVAVAVTVAVAVFVCARAGSPSLPSATSSSWRPYVWKSRNKTPASGLVPCKRSSPPGGRSSGRLSVRYVHPTPRCRVPEPVLSSCPVYACLSRASRSLRRRRRRRRSTVRKWIAYVAVLCVAVAVAVAVCD